MYDSILWFLPDITLQQKYPFQSSTFFSSLVAPSSLYVWGYVYVVQLTIFSFQIWIFTQINTAKSTRRFPFLYTKLFSLNSAANSSNFILTGYLGFGIIISTKEIGRINYIFNTEKQQVVFQVKIKQNV